ncbi:MAG: hypothetical protein RLZZ227_1028 [Pseudomonadota bacterium]|jgi:hypothetical protein
MIDSLFIVLESSLVSRWVRGEFDAATMVFPVVISLHAIGMGFLAGIACMINLRILGIAPAVPLARLAAFLPVAWLALFINLVSGLLLLIGYPTKALTNPVFYIKLLCIGVALWCLFWIRRNLLLNTSAVVTAYARRLAVIATILWTTAIVTGRLLAYTYSQLTSI